MYPVPLCSYIAAVAATTAISAAEATARPATAAAATVELVKINSLHYYRLYCWTIPRDCIVAGLIFVFVYKKTTHMGEREILSSVFLRYSLLGHRPVV